MLIENTEKKERDQLK